ncbi:MAG: T9SS type A sorting domain-containing protein [Ignavibacterium sp.]|nr:T9SS type A sorting domain-containing protein [Ignavibacterium sp.]MCX7609993.1 T9SS type A sorting domain-containing protein [Ignavibacterium sp.]MDW8376472.1 T9SS type A sorting domain-containing protein [Ignavibacteriales bacterium]
MKNFTFFFLALLLGLTDLFAQATFSTGQIDVNVNSYGRIRLFTTSDQVRHLQRASVLVGVGPNAVWDYLNDADIEVPTALVSNPQLSNFEITGTYNNAYSGAQPDVLVQYNIYGWTGGKYMILKLTIRNRQTTAINAKIGLDIIPELNQTYGNDTVTYLASQGIIRFHRGTAINMGVKLLSHTLHSLYSFDWYSGYNQDTSYWRWLNFGSIQQVYPSGAEGPVTIPSLPLINILPNASVVTYFAFALGINQTDVITAINEAQNKYNTVLSVDKISDLPVGYSLEQNYPNPFNPSTKIQFSINEPQYVTLKIYDVLGNEVANLVDKELSSGTYQYDFNASNLSSGVYYYKLQAGSFTETKKMMLMK